MFSKNSLFYISLIAFFLLFISCDEDDITPPTVEPIATLSNISVYEEGLTDSDVLVTPLGSNTTYLLDRTGNVSHRWTSSTNAFMGYLREDGSVVRAYFTNVDNGITIGGKTGGIEIIDKDNNVIWNWTLDSTTETLHHDLALLPNGNILASVWEVKSTAEAINNGRDPNSIQNDRLVIDKVIEIRPIGTDQAEIVWEWSLWDHLVQDFDANQLNFGDVTNPGLFNINLNYEGDNYTHVNGLDYDIAHDHIILNSRVLEEFLIIDHQLTTQEASGSTAGRYGKGGNILYRWGNEINYNPSITTAQQLHQQHDATYIGGVAGNTGNYLVFDNQDGLDFSSVKEIQIPINNDGSFNAAPTTSMSEVTWSYSDTGIYSARTSGAQRLISGNTLITSTSGNVIREVDNTGAILWEFSPSQADAADMEVSSVGFKSRAYPATYSGINSLNL